MQAVRRISISEIIIIGLKRVADERINRIESLFNKDGEEALTHEARVAIKQFRALWRLLRPVIPNEVYRQNNSDLRDAGRGLSIARDIVVARNSVEELLKESSSVKDRSRLESILEGLAEQESLGSMPENRKGLIRAIGILRESRDNFARLKLRKEGWEGVAQGLKKAYRRARNEMKLACSSPEDRCLHNWRKESKYLWFQLQFFELIRPCRLQKTVKRLKGLSQKLGDYHDRVILIDRLCADKNLFGGDTVAEPVIESLNKQKERLKRESFRLGKAIFSDRPKDFLSATAGFPR
jgi:CHAD domain-containing protein